MIRPVPLQVRFLHGASFELARFSASVERKHSDENCHTETFWFTSVACLPLPDR